MCAIEVFVWKRVCAGQAPVRSLALKISVILGHTDKMGTAPPGHCPPRSEPIDFVRSMNTKIFSHCLILFALSYFNEYVKA